MGRTSAAFGNLRALTILLVVTFHSVLAYLGSQPAVQPPFDALPLTWRAFPIQDNTKFVIPNPLPMAELEDLLMTFGLLN